MDDYPAKAWLMIDYDGSVDGYWIGPDLTSATLYVRADLAEGLASALRECAADLAVAVDGRYRLRDGTVHPAMQSKYERDMAPVVDARAALAAYEEGVK